MAALHHAGFANLDTSRHLGDGLQLDDAYISAAVRCAPPANKPLPEEITRCLDHLDAELEHLPNLRVVVALGRIGFDAWLQVLKRRGVRAAPRPRFAHGSVATLDVGDTGLPALLVGCYHPSRQNTNTGVLTAAMMRAVFRKARRVVDGVKA
jgi:uracil-DNA glycosylase family 4